MSFWRTTYHLVWATHNRQPLIDAAVEQRLFPYLEKKAAEFQAIVYAVNGIEDHIHLVIAIPPRFAVAEVVKSLKGASSHFLNHGRPPLEFGWQRGYGVFTLGENASGRRPKPTCAPRRSTIARARPIAGWNG